jgi:hypothetical protein
MLCSLYRKQRTMRTLINKYNIGLSKTPCVLSLISTMQAKTMRERMVFVLACIVLINERMHAVLLKPVLYLLMREHMVFCFSLHCTY